MAKTRPGVDRITRQGLQARHAYAVMVLHKHLKECLKCKRAQNNLYRRCDLWWQFAKAEHITARKLREYSQPETGNLIPMFMEQQCDPPPF